MYRKQPGAGDRQMPARQRNCGEGRAKSNRDIANTRRPGEEPGQMAKGVEHQKAATQNPPALQRGQKCRIKRQRPCPEPGKGQHSQQENQRRSEDGVTMMIGDSPGCSANDPFAASANITPNHTLTNAPPNSHGRCELRCCKLLSYFVMSFSFLSVSTPFWMQVIPSTQCEWGSNRGETPCQFQKSLLILAYMASHFSLSFGPERYGALECRSPGFGQHNKPGA